MYCSNCGRQVEEAARYCSQCGAARGTIRSADPSPGVNRLSRPRTGKWVAGVCAGVARYLQMDVTLVRILWLLIAIFPSIPGIVAYIVCWIVMPLDPEPVAQPTPPASETVDA
jgi:phage shock protein C